MKNKKLIIFSIILMCIAALPIIFSIKTSKNLQNNEEDTYMDDQVAENIEEEEEVRGDESENEPKTYESQPEMQLKEGVNYKAVIKTSKGNINLDLFEDQTPITVNNFVFLASDDFYADTFFHRIIEGFMIQGGDPEGTGRGGPGYRFEDEDFEGEYTAGTIAMANAGPDTNGSQFFIMHEDYDLPKDYIIFGRASDEQSLEVIDDIATISVEASATGEKSKPIEKVFIEDIEIIEE